MSLQSNCAAAVLHAESYRRKNARRFKKLTGVTIDTPTYVEKYDEEEDLLTVVSHYYKEDPRIQGVFFYQGNRFLGHQVRAYQSTRNLKTIKQTLQNALAAAEQ